MSASDDITVRVSPPVPLGGAADAALSGESRAQVAAEFGGLLGDFQLEKPGGKIGPYTLIEELGSGGFGVVWKAEQHVPIHRMVALKVVKPGMDSREIVARFETERHALALMEHPNIARVLDAGATVTGRPFFVMELVDGPPVTLFCDQHKLAIGERLELFIQVCHAVQHAHQKAILHRDIKPSNILVIHVDGRAVPKVIDFGIAKALSTDAMPERSMATQEGMFIGTPQYMSPEQASGNAAEIDTRADIYGLGVVLYELLTGATPLSRETMAKAGLDEIVRLIREAEPPRPSDRVARLGDRTAIIATQRHTEPRKLTMQLRGDLDWIVLKALEKDRERRYASAAAFAQDIENHLHDVPVSASPPSRVYRLRKLVVRNKLAFAAIAAIALTLIAGVTFSTLSFFREKAARQRAERAETAEALQRKLAEIQAESATAQVLAPTRPMDALARATWAAMKSAEVRGRATPETLNSLLLSLDAARLVWQVNLDGSDILAAALALDARSAVLSALESGRLTMRDAKSGVILRTHDLPMGTAQTRVTSLGMTPDGSTIVVGRTDGALFFLSADLQTELKMTQAHTGPVRSIAWSGKRGAFVTVGGEGTVRFWHADGSAAEAEIKLKPGAVGRAAFDDGARHLVTTHGNMFGASLLFTSLDDPTVAATTADLGPLRHTTLALSPDGGTIALGTDEGFVQLWLSTGVRLRLFPAHVGMVQEVFFAPDGRGLYSVGDDGRLQFWTLDGKAVGAALSFPGSGGSATALLPQSGIICCSRFKGGPRAFDLLGLELQAPIVMGRHVRALMWSPDGKKLAALDTAGSVIFFDAQSGAKLREVGTASMALTTNISASAMLPRIALAGYEEKKLSIYDWNGDKIADVALPVGADEAVHSLAWREQTGEVWVLTSKARLMTVSQEGKVTVRDESALAQGRNYDGFLASSKTGMAEFVKAKGSASFGENEIKRLRYWRGDSAVKAERGPQIFPEDILVRPSHEQPIALSDSTWEGRIAVLEGNRKKVTVLHEVGGILTEEHHFALGGVSNPESIAMDSADRLLFITTDMDGLLILSEDGDQLGPHLFADETRLQHAVMRPDGEALACAGESGRIRILRIGPQPWLKLARARLLQMDEWRQTKDAHMDELARWLKK